MSDGIESSDQLVTQGGVDGAREPILRIQDAQARVVCTMPLTRLPVTIGRTSDSDIVLKSDVVSRRHAQLYWNATLGCAVITDLNSGNGTYLDKQPIPPNQPQQWRGQQPVKIADFLLHLEIKASGTPNMNPAGIVRNNANQAVADLSASSQVSIALPEGDLTLVPGMATPYVLALKNTGNLVEHVRIEVDGLVVKVEGEDTHLNPGPLQSVAISLTVPRKPESRPGPYAVVVRAISLTTHAELGAVHARWRVEPFTETVIRPESSELQSWGSGTYTLQIQNNGNGPVEYAISATDDLSALQFVIDPPRLKLKECDEARVRLRVRETTRRVGPMVWHKLVVHVNANPGGAHEVPLKFGQKAIPRLVLTVLIALLAVGGLLFYKWLSQPALINNVDEKLDVLAGDEIVLPFKVDNAQRVEVQLNGKQLQASQFDFNPENGEGLIRVPPAATGTVSLFAFNKLNMQADKKEWHLLMATPTVTPLPTQTHTPTPTIEPAAARLTSLTCQELDLEFNGNRIRCDINQGESVRITWQFSNAASVSFAGQDSYSAQDSWMDRPPENEQLTLIGYNAAGKPSTTYTIFITVRPNTATPRPAESTNIKPNYDEFCGGEGKAVLDTSRGRWYCQSDLSTDITDSPCKKRFGQTASARAENPLDKGSWTCWAQPV